MANARHQSRRTRGRRIRHKIRQVAGDRPRLSVYRSLNHIYAQIIDDQAGRTLVAASTIDKEIREGLKNGSNREAAGKVGKAIAEKAKKANINQVVFDRGGYIYHGRIKVLADAAREGGLEF
ncbi:MAG: 50S ribosomal protein L18 [Magnetococcales bacterium]|nr:50S ribosomal protein L18 [Magnetococcales bacterium]